MNERINQKDHKEDNFSRIRRHVKEKRDGKCKFNHQYYPIHMSSSSSSSRVVVFFFWEH